MNVTEGHILVHIIHREKMFGKTLDWINSERISKKIYS